MENIKIMDILDKITELREERHWSEYQLAEKSGLTQSTISSWYRKGILPSIPSLEKICDAFGLSLSQFFIEEEFQAIVPSNNQARLLAYAAKLAPEQYDALLQFLKSL